jgi:hypothetical protein
MAKQTFTTGQVLTAAQMTSLQQTAMLGGAASAKTASYTLVAADAGTSISMSNASATTITVNTALFAAGDTVQITNLGAGVCTITAGTATVNTSASLALAQYESGTLTFTSTSAAIFIKGAGAAAASGGMTLLSTTTLSGATTTISSISGSYNSLVAYVFGVTNATAAGTFRIAPNASTTTSFWTSTTTDTGANKDTDYNLTGGYLDLVKSAYALENTLGNNFWTIEFPYYANSTVEKAFTLNGQYTANTGAAKAWRTQFGRFNSTAAITSLVFSNSGGNLSAGTVLLYGVK